MAGARHVLEHAWGQGRNRRPENTLCIGGQRRLKQRYFLAETERNFSLQRTAIHLVIEIAWKNLFEPFHEGPEVQGLFAKIQQAQPQKLAIGALDQQVHDMLMPGSDGVWRRPDPMCRRHKGLPEAMAIARDMLEQRYSGIRLVLRDSVVASVNCYCDDFDRNGSQFRLPRRLLLHQRFLQTLLCARKRQENPHSHRPQKRAGRPRAHSNRQRKKMAKALPRFTRSRPSLAA